MDQIENTHKVSEVKLSYKSKVKASDRVKVTCARDAFKVLYQLWDQQTIEHIETFKILMLNRANLVLGMATISNGGISGTVIDVRIIFQFAIKTNSTQLILAHNHPSGSLKPSEADINITRKIFEGAKQLDINLLDHIILIRDERYYSFAEEGDL